MTRLGRAPPRPPRSRPCWPPDVENIGPGPDRTRPFAISQWAGYCLLGTTSVPLSWTAAAARGAGPSTPVGPRLWQDRSYPRPGGGTGRRSGLKIRRPLRPCRFDSGSGHHLGSRSRLASPVGSPVDTVRSAARAPSKVGQGPTRYRFGCRWRRRMTRRHPALTLELAGEVPDPHQGPIACARPIGRKGRDAFDRIIRAGVGIEAQAARDGATLPGRAC